MRLSFSNDVPIEEQITRSMKRKQKGRKHNFRQKSPCKKKIRHVV